MEIEHFFICPYCWQNISMVLDLSVTDQSYIEDCEVCCRPVNIRYKVVNEDLNSFEADSIEQ